MTYKIGGTEIIIQPTEGRWLPRRSVGYDGNGRPIYPSVREFELRWGLLNASGTSQLQTFFASVGTTGTAVVTLPQYANPTYQFYDYSGCVLQEPQFATFFNQHTNDVILLVTKIRT